jgi:predicted RNA-binding protein with PUA-like domain
MNYWLVKQEPEDYAWEQFVQEGSTAWTGVRNFQARNHLKAMQKGDLVLFYHSGEQKRVVGISKVSQAPYPDPTAKEGDWWCVDLKPVKKLKTPVELKTIKGDRLLKVALVRQSRLSVMPLKKAQFEHLLSLGR